MQGEKVEINLLFETSWEVCNKVGGIYTVLSTKARTLQKLYKDKVIFIGPDVWPQEKPCPYFVEDDALLSAWKNGSNLPYGIKVRTGRWDVPGKPIAILVGFDGLYAVKNDFYHEMWNAFKVDSLHAYGDYDEACAFSHAAGIVIKSIVDSLSKSRRKNIIAHFDEWTTGMGLLYVKKDLPEVATIFTTHATSIGRSICGNGKELYRYFKGYNGDQMASELNMVAKHSLEKAAAQNADCFTTVSDITADECEQLLERRPSIVTPNGFEDNFVPKKNSYASKRKKSRKTLISVAEALTGAKFDEKCFIIGTSGRCEYRNKGLDVFIDSVNRLGDLDPEKKILAFIMVPAWVKEARQDLMHNLSLKHFSALPDPICTHTLFNYNEDPVINHLRWSGFTNDKESRIHVIYVPCYLNGSDGVFNTPYYDLIIGMDVTVFPSYYEPWGYTPLESIAFGIPTITTSLSGFGRWILSNYENNIYQTGVKVVARNDENYNETCKEISNEIKGLIKSGVGVLEETQKNARQTSMDAAWTYFIDYYVRAFKIALDNRAKEIRRNRDKRIEKED